MAAVARAAGAVVVDMVIFFVWVADMDLRRCVCRWWSGGVVRSGVLDQKGRPFGCCSLKV
jgi:hypothetical protein